VNTETIDNLFGLYQINKSEEFYKKCNHYLTSDDTKDFRDFFNKKQCRISDTVISYRLINHWEKEGLVKSSRGENNKGWRYYSLMDLVWLSIVIRLRNFGYSIENIRKSKPTIAAGINECEYGELEFYTATAYVNNVPVYALFFSNFQGEVANLYEILDSSEKRGVLDHISINVNAILQRLFPNKNLKPVYTNFKELTEQDDEILETIRDEKVEEIKLSIKNGTPLKMDFTVNEPVDSNIGQLKNKNTYQKIEVTQHKSKTTSVKRTISKKFKSNED